MTYEDAKRFLKEFDHNETPMGEDFFLYTEAMDYFIKKGTPPFDIMLLGSEYAVRNKHDIARKYFEKAAELGEPLAISSLAMTYFYGNGVDRNLEVAKFYAKQAYESDDKFASFDGGFILAMIYSAEDYHGKNTELSRGLLEELLERTEDDEQLRSSNPSLYEELGDIYMAEGDEDKALQLYLMYKDYTAYNLSLVNVPDSQRDMDTFMDKLHCIPSYQPEEYDLYDLYWLMKKPAKVRFGYDGERFFVKSFYEDGELHIKFGGREYRSVADFIERAEIDGTRIQALFFELDTMEVVG